MNKTSKHIESSNQTKKRKFLPVIIKKRRKDNHCLNCGADFDDSFNYCPKCGQENNHNRVSFTTLVVDFLNNYFSFDSKFSKSLLPFFFDPGYLTNKFVEGKRASFVNPIRLYLIISLIFFFVFSMVSNDIIQDSVNDFDKASDEITEQLSDSSKVLLDEVLAGNLSNIESDSIYTLVPDQQDSTKNLSFSIQKPDSTNEFFTEENIAIYMRFRKNYDVSVDQVLDSLETSSLSSFQYNLTRKLFRLDRAEPQIVISQLLKNLPLMMLLILPVFALLLKLFYMRRDQYYITHLIHALHLHSFAYVIYGFAFLMAMYWLPVLPKIGTGFWTIFLSLILVSTHSYISFLKVYQQGWFKTFIKFNLIGILYTSLLLFALALELLFSVATY